MFFSVLFLFNLQFNFFWPEVETFQVQRFRFRFLCTIAPFFTIQIRMNSTILKAREDTIPAPIMAQVSSRAQANVIVNRNTKRLPLPLDFSKLTLMAADETLDVLREQPPAYGAFFIPSPILAYLRKAEAAHAQGNDTEHARLSALKRTPLKLDWNMLHIQSRLEICLGACVSEKMAHKSWEELDRWLQALLEYSTKLRSSGKIQLCG